MYDCVEYSKSESGPPGQYLNEKGSHLGTLQSLKSKITFGISWVGPDYTRGKNQLENFPKMVLY